MAESAVWQDVAPLTGWLASDAEAMRLQRSLRHAADALAAKKAGGDDDHVGEAAAFGASILRSYEEEQRLVTENARLRSQLEAMRRQFDEDGEWRRDARQLASALSQKEQHAAALRQQHQESLAHLGKELDAVSSDLRASQGAEASLTQQTKALQQELDACRVRLASQERLCIDAQERANQLQTESESHAWLQSRLEILEQEKSVLSTQLHAAAAARDSKDAHILSLCTDSDAAMKQCKALAASVAELTEKAQRVATLEARNAELEKMVMEASASREALGKEVAARDDEIRACQQRVHMLQEEALQHRQQLHAAHADASSLRFKVEDTNSALATAQVCVCVCVCVRARACVRASARGHVTPPIQARRFQLGDGAGVQ